MQPREVAKQPEVARNPLFEVEVADEVTRSAPPVRVMPLPEERPPVREREERVLVAVFVWRRVPPERVIPWVEASPAAVAPPEKVEVALFPTMVVVPVDPT